MKLFVHHDPVEFTSTKFPGGETLIRLVEPAGIPSGYDTINAMITMDFASDADLIRLLLLTDAVRRYYGPNRVKLTLTMPYLPYARQDRVCSVGESLSIKVVADLINGQGYEKVYCTDIHSEVGVALINNLVHIDQTQAASKLAVLHPDAILVSPDAGANKKVLAFAKRYGYKDVVRADKTRDTLTGHITGTAVYSENVGNRDFLILDDICDGGRTFVELAKELRKLTTGRIFLYVSHGIFSQGLLVLSGQFERIYVANLVGVGMKQATDPLLQILN